MRKWLCFVLLVLLLVPLGARAEENLLPLVHYEFADADDLGCDSRGIQPLVNRGGVSQGSVSEGVRSAVFSSSNALAAIPLGGMDVLDSLTEFTITLWGKHPSSQWQDCYMLASGLPGGTGVALGFRAKKEAFMVAVGGVRTENLDLNTRAPQQTQRFEKQKSWNFYSLTVQDRAACFAINGEVFEVQGLNGRTVSAADGKYLLTLGGLCAVGQETVAGGFKGELADVRIYDRALTAEQMEQLHAAGPGGDPLKVTSPVIRAVDPPQTDGLTIVRGAPQEQLIALVADCEASFTASDGTVHADGGIIWTRVDENEGGIQMEGVVHHPAYANPDGLTVKVTIPYGYDRFISLPGIFCDGMVLQREKVTRIFGTGGAPGDAVTVDFAGQTVRTVCDENAWEAVLSPMEACAVNRTMTICYTPMGENEPIQTITIDDVLVGEVWLGSGQSNMTYTLREMLNLPGIHPDFYQDYQKIDNWERLRFFTAPYAEATEPRVNTSRNMAWEAPSGTGRAQGLPGLAVAFASHLQTMLGTDVPVGFVTCAVGGASIEEWLDAVSMAELPSHAAFMGKQDSRFYNAMLYPLAGYTLRGVVWYQGEANVPWVEDYRLQFAALRTLYRDTFADDALPFIVMQLPQYEDARYVQFREMQWDIMTQDAHVYTVCGIDLGDPTNIHPTDKYTFGERAAGVALREIYGLAPTEGMAYGLSPAIVEAVHTADGIALTVSDAVTLTAQESITGFEIRINGRWQAATAHLRDGRIIVDCEDTRANAVRYLQEAFFTDGDFVYNEYGLPLAPKAAMKITQ